MNASAVLIKQRNEIDFDILALLNPSNAGFNRNVNVTNDDKLSISFKFHTERHSFNVKLTRYKDPDYKHSFFSVHSFCLFEN